MFEWRVNQIRLSMMERVLNHMERQGFEVQKIIPLLAPRTSCEAEVILAGKKLLSTTPSAVPHGLPAVTALNIDSIHKAE